MTDITDMYELIEYNDVTGVKITKGKYAGIIYSYGLVRVSELQEASETGVLKFNYYLHEFENFNGELLQDDPEFDKLMGDILVDVMQSWLDNPKPQISLEKAEFNQTLINEMLIEDGEHFNYPTSKDDLLNGNRTTNN